ncbi:S10 family peptidase [Olivibacter domesticus]|uniref:Carboxypeptidase C (Cathepsin A) n=1 Tax=Olivibacter domesticus TaxID=407022 RepID=A0A1H7QQ82_OLID1|nr:hypothetical protein [Olivibacter domesticus]SEL49765.1 Carboxypeptidase C (cathepsin A) [Olivibacter domesticus]
MNLQCVFFYRSHFILAALVFNLFLYTTSFAQRGQHPPIPRGPQYSNKEQLKNDSPSKILDTSYVESNNAVIPMPVTKQHQVQIRGKLIKYTTTTGYIQLKNEEGEPKGNVFFVAYTADGEKKVDRPVTFAFNGGPGSSSVWVHMGFMGPKRPKLTDEGESISPYGYEDNPESWLDKTDLVFIDPISTGYSRAVKGENPAQFHGFVEDVQSVADFIRLYITKNERWASPKYIMGESYGTPRAAGLAQYLQDRYSLYFDGVIMLSSILNMQTARFDIGNDLPYPLFLPTYTATAWYHKQLEPALQQDLKKTLTEVEAFAKNEYTLALMKGSDLSDAEYTTIAEKLAKYTGLNKDYVVETNLRINIHKFCKELRRKEGLTVGRLDSRFTGRDYDDAGETFEFDPAGKSGGTFAASFNHYIRTELGYKNNLPYDVSGRVQPWNYNNVQNKYLNTAEYLRQAMAKNPDLKVWVICGYYDLATPYAAAEYVFKHMNLRPEQQPKVNFTYYEAGHMVYMPKNSMLQLNKDADQFYSKK